MPVTEPHSACNYHKKTAASWTCVGCETKFCDKCIPYGHCDHWGRSGPRCILCNRELRFSDASKQVTPFWNMLPHFFAYPLKSGSRSVIAIVAIAAAILPGLGFLALFAAIFLAAVCVKYSFLIIERRAEDDPQPPSSGELFTRDEHYLFLKLVASMLVLYGGAYYFAHDKPMLFTVLNGLITFILPALTIILAMQKSLLTALNPLVMLSFILRIGWAYLLVFFCYQIVSSGPTWVLGVIGESVPLYLLTPMAVAIGVYFWFSANCMLGYTVYQYSDELGLGDMIAQKHRVDVDRDLFDKKRAIAEAYMLIRENEAERARKLLRPLLDHFKRDAELHDFYHKLLIVLEDKEALKNHADYFIELLVEQSRLQEATQIYLSTLEKLPHYQAHDIECAYQIAQHLDRQGRRREIPKLLNNIHKLNLRHESLAPAYLLLAKVYSEHFSKDSHAIKIIDFVLDISINSSVREELIRFKKDLQQVA